MDDFGGLWILMTVGGVIALGLALAYATMRNRKMTRGEKIESEEGTARVYAEEQRAPEN